MKIEVFLNLYPVEAQTSCLECQFLHQPNLDEGYLICLKTLQEIAHEIDYEIDCSGFIQISPDWEPIYVASENAYY